jgi:hypothetical protein
LKFEIPTGATIQSVLGPTLAYDDLPPGSDIRRSYDGDTVQITVPAGEPPLAVLQQAAYEALASGAISSWALLVLACVIFYFGIRTNRISGVTLTWAWIFFAIFCAALVMLVCWIRYGLLADALRAGRQQTTILAANAQRLLIETAGPFGTASHDLPRDAIARIEFVRAPLRDHSNRAYRLRHLRLSLSDGRIIPLLPARDARELHAIATILRTTLHLPPPEKSPPTP